METASDGVEALEKVRESPPDMIVSDILMPKMDGFQLCRTLKSDEKLKDIPVLFYSATYTDKKSLELALGVGAAGYITKPIEPNKLIKIIRETFEKYGKGKLKPAEKPLEEQVYMKMYNEQLIQKLEVKMLDLQRSEAKYRSVVESVDDLIYLIDRGNRFLSFNKKPLERFGMTPEEVIGREISEIISDPAAAGFSMQMVRKVFETEKSVSYERELDLGGLRRWYSITMAPVFEADGSVIAAACIGRDITDRRLAEARIEHLNSVLVAIRNVNQLIITEKDRDSLLQKSCDALVEARGYGVTWIGFSQDGETFASVLGSGFREDISRFSEQVMRGDHPPCIKNTLTQKEIFRVVDRSGECGDCLFKNAHVCAETAIIRLEYGDRLFGLLAIPLAADTPVDTEDAEEEELLKEVASDITFALHDMEVEAAERAASLYARNLIEASLDPLVTIGPDGMIMDVNHAMEVVTGVSRERLTGSDFSDYFTEPDKAREGYQQVFSQGFVTEYPITIRHTSGRMTDVLYNATVYRNEAGKVQGVLATARDITERKLAEKRINEEYRRAEFYIDLMSHDINNVSQVTRGYLEMLLKMPDFHPKFKRYAEIALDHVRKGTDIISNVKTISTVRSGELEIEKIDIYPAFASAVETAKSQPMDVKINSNITEGRYFIRGNALLFDVFSNLLNNAIKFDGHDIVEIDVDISSSGDDWAIEFKDRGRGIRYDYKKIIFDRLARAGESAQGTGLGLTIVKYIVASYGGSIWVEDRVRGDRTLGSNFTILLPKGG